MRRSARHLWPYTSTTAFIASAFVFLILALLVAAFRRATDWPSDVDLFAVLIVILLLSLTPIWLLLLDFLSERGAKIGSKWLSVDFGNVDLARATNTGEQVTLPANLGVTGPMVSDTAPMDIIAALREAEESDVALIDIRGGKTWWVTRLIAFVAGAKRRGAPEAIVFVGQQGGKPRQFLGWADPSTVLEAILRDKPGYRRSYRVGNAIARQLTLFRVRDKDLAPEFSGGNLNSDVLRYINPPSRDPNKPPPDYLALGSAAAEQIIMDQYAHEGLEAPPDELTLTRLKALLDHVLIMEHVDLNVPGEEQVKVALATQGEFVALVRDGHFVSMLRRSDVDRSILRQMIFAAEQSE